jgi:hypothetical protein
MIATALAVSVARAAAVSALSSNEAVFLAPEKRRQARTQRASISTDMGAPEDAA